MKPDWLHIPKTAYYIGVFSRLSAGYKYLKVNDKGWLVYVTKQMLERMKE